jgi:hypothetical protein
VVALRVTPEQLALLRQDGDPALRKKVARSVSAAKARRNGDAWETEVCEWLKLGRWVWQRGLMVKRPSGDGWWEPVRGTAGFPDIRAFHEDRGLFVVAELKAGAGRVSPAQQRWLDNMARAGVRAEVWHERDRVRIQRFILGR